MLAKVWQRQSTAPPPLTPAPLVPATSSPATSTPVAAPSTPAPSTTDTADPLADVPPSVVALAEPTPPPRLDAAQLDTAAQLRERDPTVAHALAAHVETTEHAQTAAEAFAAALDRHGAGPDEPTARATWVRTLAGHDRDVAIALAAALATVEATEHTAAQLDAALAPYAARAPPLRAPFDA